MCVCLLVLLLNYVPELFLINIVLTLARSQKVFAINVLSCLPFPSENSETTSTKTKWTPTGGGAVREMQQSEKLFPFNASYVYAYACMNISLETFIPILPLFGSSSVLLRQPRKYRFHALPDCLTTYILFPHANSLKLCIHFVLSPSECEMIIIIYFSNKYNYLNSQRWRLACSVASSFVLSCILWMLILGTFLISSS